ncbi:MAG: YcxB family protein [Oscillospiraceae bacterium]|nr:YcxB family protein [Oscillospiraceae bacterium]
MTQINYNNTIPEIKRAYSLFRRKYALPRMIPLTIAFLIVLVFGVDFVFRNSSSFTGYILIALAVGMGVSLWTRPIMAQKKLVDTVSELNDERYTARFFDDRIEIDTEIIPDDGALTEIVAITKYGVDTVENPEVLEQAEKQIIQPETSTIGITSEELFSVEDGEIFCLFVNRALIYIFPKRCLTDEQAAEIRDYFKNKAI